MMAEIVALKSAASDGPVQVAFDKGILRLTLASPPANALSIAVMEALTEEFERARDDKAVRVIVLAAAGKVFCAGHDLKELTLHRADADRGRAFFEKTFAACSTLMQQIVRNPKPVIAEVDGLATAAGLQLVASCDLAICSNASTFCTPASTSPVLLDADGGAVAQCLAQTGDGDAFDRRDGRRRDRREFGVVNRVVPPEYLNQTVTKYAQVIASKSPLTLKIGKEAFYEQIEMGLSQAYDYTGRVMVENMLACDAEEGIGAFIGKRKPEWKGE